MVSHKIFWRVPVRASRRAHVIVPTVTSASAVPAHFPSLAARLVQVASYLISDATIDGALLCE
jgi:hypothetical protein